MSADPGELVIAEVLPKKRLGKPSPKSWNGLVKERAPRPSAILLYICMKFRISFLPMFWLKLRLAVAHRHLDGWISATFPLSPSTLGRTHEILMMLFLPNLGTMPKQKAGTEDGGLRGWHLIVAIADVAWYVRPGSELDREAREAGQLSLFPDRVIPMLPEALSNGWCSLKPDEDRPCLAAHLWINGAGELQTFKFQRAMLRSHARLTYEQVQQVRDSEKGGLAKRPVT